MLIWPGTALAWMAALTAPQLAWPRTRMTLVPRTVTPYSRLPMISGVGLDVAVGDAGDEDVSDGLVEDDLDGHA